MYFSYAFAWLFLWFRLRNSHLTFGERMNDMADVSPTDPIELVKEAFENALRALENALAVKFREGYEKGQFDARNEMVHSLEEVIKTNDQHPSARALAIMNTNVDDLVEVGELSVRTRNCLAWSMIYTIGEIVEETAENLLNISNFGQASLSEVHILLGKRGLALKK